jgi:hypothetical protein
MAQLVLYIFRARPELVEGYLRALEDILQQVQDERGTRFKLGNASDAYI